MAHIIRSGKAGYIRIASLGVFFFFISSFSIFGQTTCTGGVSAPPTIHAEGLAEQLGTITMTCAGGTYPLTTLIAVTVNANITNRVDANGNLENVTIAGSANNQSQPPTLSSANTLIFPAVQLMFPGQFTISGIRAAFPSVTGGGPLVTASVYGQGIQILNSQPQLLASSHASLLDTVINNGVLCGSPPPATMDFPGLAAVGTSSSTVRVTEGYSSAFLPKGPTDDAGVRILLSLAGYNSDAQVYVPNAIVGNTGLISTSAGAFGFTFNAGTYTPGSHELLLMLVNGADVTGAGGTWASAVPTNMTTFASVTQIPILNGAGYAVYEVVDSNPILTEWAQIPVFYSVPLTNCSASIADTLTPELAPVSTVSIATPTDPIPRFIAATPGPDCQQVGDCGAGFVPQLSVGQTAITLNGSSAGLVQTATEQVVNSGSGQFTFLLSLAYPSVGANWLSISPTSGGGGTLLTLTANPASLAPGVYQATVTINAGNAGTATVPVTFNVGPLAPVLQVLQSSIALNAPVSGTSASASVNITNTHLAAGQMTFSTSIVYQFGNASLANINWLSITPASGTDNTTLTLTASPASLAAGVYQATVIVNAGNAGSVNLPVTFTVTAPVPTIQGVVNAANSQPGPIAAGSFAAIYGLNLSPKTTAPPTVTFAGSPATILYDGATQINVLVPAALGSATTAGVIATIDGVVSNTFSVTLTPNAPAVFSPGILNQNNSVNSGSAPASSGDEIQIFLTGLSTALAPPVTVNIGNSSLTGTQIIYAGVVFSSPGVIYLGLDQVNVQVPTGLTFTGNSVPLSICVPGTSTEPVCSAPVNLYLQ
ncbi:MAG TPA: hypothetical protein VGL82_14435 [Bryobacteraceae bacterium]|jgi:uncharacterized protein (TIGR03437 family)